MPGMRLTTYSWAQQQLMRAGLRLHRSGWTLVRHLRVVLSAGSTTAYIPRKGESVAHGTLSFWTEPINPLWLVGSDDGSIAHSCTYP